MPNAKIETIVRLAVEVIKDLPTFDDLQLLRDELLELHSVVNVLREQQATLLKAIEQRVTPH